MENSDGGSREKTATYRAYLIGKGDRIENATHILAENDEEAVKQARQLVDGHAVELWDRSRMIARFLPDKP